MAADWRQSLQLEPIGASLSRTSFCTAPMPVGQMGTVKYVLTSMPTTTANYLQVGFSVSARGPPGAWGLTSLPLPGRWLDWVVGGVRGPQALADQARCESAPRD